MSLFKLSKSMSPAGDQPKAIEALDKGLKKGMRKQTLFGVTGSGKTFTMANIIAHHGKPTLVIAHNKTLAAQLAQEYREFFPENAVHYFVSYYDYYQPEAYMPVTDTYIEKEAMINEEIERLRHASTQALLTRKDVIIVASVSCIYGLGSPVEYEKVNLKIAKSMELSRSDLIRRLIGIHFERTNADIGSGQFRALGNMIEIMPVSDRTIYRIEYDGSVVSNIIELDPITMSVKGNHDIIFLFPAKHFISTDEQSKRAFETIKAELESRLKELEKSGKMLEAERLKRRVKYDLALIREVGYCNGIENYSRHFSGKKPGEAPDSLLSYFPHKADGSADFLTVIDESHVTVPQLGGMYAGDASRKKTLIDFGFRLPSAYDNRPMKFDEFEKAVGQVIYTTATPGKFEKEHSDQIVEQIIRPTGLIDPVIEVHPVAGRREEDRSFEEHFAVRRRENSAKPAGFDARSEKDISSPATFPSSYPGQIFDFIEEALKVIKKGDRAIATTLTKKMAEDLSEFLKEKGIKSEYLHSDIKTIDRITILTEFRKGTFDVLVGVNLLREGLDLPEVSLIGILDADKAGFLRSETSLIQIIGRAARNVNGRVILYADIMNDTLRYAINETERRRNIQIAHNTKYGITPKTIIKKIQDITDQLRSEHDKAVHELARIDLDMARANPEKFIKEKEKAMSEAVKELDFETAALTRDEIAEIKKKFKVDEGKLKKDKKIK